jgi:tetratricopeptide (TPR) repeat protein
MSPVALVGVCAGLAVVAAAGVLSPLRGSIARTERAPARGTRSSGNGSARARPARADRLRGSAPALAAGLALVAVTVPFLLGAFGRSNGAPSADATPMSAIEGFRQQVAEHPEDVAARLELGFLLLNQGDAGGAAQQYMAVLQRDPTNAEAHTQLAWVLLGVGRPRAALQQVDQALQARTGYAEALWVRGVILLRGLHRPRSAAQAFTAYLKASPYGAHRQEAQGLLREARSGGSGQGG